MHKVKIQYPVIDLVNTGLNLSGNASEKCKNILITGHEGTIGYSTSNTLKDGLTFIVDNESIEKRFSIISKIENL